MTCFVVASVETEAHQLWVECDNSEEIVTFDCPECDYWKIVRGQPTIEQMRSMQCVAIEQLRNKRCRT
jgi:predicted RNA-binding Zn-ribbon protein involved in translation (DUF1610 family)